MQHSTTFTQEKATAGPAPTHGQGGEASEHETSRGAQTIDIPCPHCGQKLRQTIGQLKTKSSLTCKACKGTFDLDATDLRRKVAGVEKQLADFARKLGRLGK